MDQNYIDTFLNTLQIAETTEKPWDSYENLRKYGVEKIISFLGGTGVVINDVLTKPQIDSGQMVIIRVPQIKDGKRMRQSLSIAKVISGMKKLEIIQDFGAKTSLDKHIDEAIEFAKSKNRPGILRIPKRIQTNHCEKLNAKGQRGCNCTERRNHENGKLEKQY